VGKLIQKTIAGTDKKATLELGGKSANIIFDDAPLDQAVEGIINGIFFNQGHVCCAGSRLFVQENIADKVIRKLKERMEYFQVDCALPNKGYYCKPTLFINVAQSSVLAQEEIFGPVLTIQTFRTIDEVIQKANNSPYGLAAGVWTDKGSKIFNLTSKLKAGVVWANTYNKFDPASPFGGYKESGFGREGGLHGLGAYLK
jgi:aldehyde dehydrogenase (NAD+)